MPSSRPEPGYLLLEDGTVFPGLRFLGQRPALGEAVFNTSHSGYQEILSDPSYCRQILVFTAPHIGNVGINRDDLESDRVQVAAAVMRSLSPRPSSWRAEGDLPEWLGSAEVPLLAGANTRAITLHLRSRGAMRAGLFPQALPVDAALQAVQESPSMAGADLAAAVSCSETYTFDPTEQPLSRGQGRGLRVGVVDFGVKRSILRQLAIRGCEVTVLPARDPAARVLSRRFHGVLLSNGPGDPAAVSYGIATAAAVLDAGLPTMGICLGHQLLALAAGGKTFKLPFGHRGANHPVRREADGTVEITSQNHGFGVRPGGLGSEWLVTHVNLNDHTVEGLAHRTLPVFSIQYHPEASPGPHDALGYFDAFVQEMRRAQG